MAKLSSLVLRMGIEISALFLALPSDCHVLCMRNVKIIGAYKVPYKDFVRLMHGVCIETDEPRITALSGKVAPFRRVS